MTTSSLKPELTREDSLDAESLRHPPAEGNEDTAYGPDDNDEEALNLPPGRMHATRVPQRLSGSREIVIPPSLRAVLQQHLKQKAQSQRPRSKSPSLTRATATTDANSSISSLEDIVDQDILYDRAGFSELESRPTGFAREFANLPPVNERLCEETLEDVHAFSDVPSHASRANSVGNPGESFLDRLDECEEEEDDESVGEPQQVILTNMENLQLEPHSEPQTAASSLVGEAPSAPTTE